MINEQPCSSLPGCSCKLCFKKKCLSWSAVFVGALVGVGLSFLLTLFSIAIGLTTFKTTNDSVTAFAIGGFLGFAIGTMASMFVAGWTAGYLGRACCVKRNLGVLYGFTAWCIALIFTIILSSPITRFIPSYSGYITNNNVSVVRMVNEPVRVVNAQNNRAMTTTVDTEKSANEVGKAGLVLFVLFFLGALASCLGGHCGMTYRKEECCPSNLSKV